MHAYALSGGVEEGGCRGRIERHVTLLSSFDKGKSLEHIPRQLQNIKQETAR